MDLKDRIALIIEENDFKQIELAEIIGVSGSYVSTLLSGRNRNVSASVAGLIEEKLGYSADWVLSGTGPKFKASKRRASISDVHSRAIFKLERMSEERAGAVLAFIESLDKVEAALGTPRRMGGGGIYGGLNAVEAATDAPPLAGNGVGGLFAAFADSKDMTDEKIERLKKKLEQKKGKNG